MLFPNVLYGVKTYLRTKIIVQDSSQIGVNLCFTIQIHPAIPSQSRVNAMGKKFPAGILFLQERRQRNTGIIRTVLQYTGVPVCEGCTELDVFWLWFDGLICTG
jgi:hypothetical protein